MDGYKYVINSIVHTNIYNFYINVLKKYQNAYSLELMEKNISDAYDSIYQIENGLPRRNPTIQRWQNKGFMANTRKWYFLYHINGDTIYVDDACHTQNMHENISLNISKLIREYLQSNYMVLSESRAKTTRVRLNESQLCNMLGYIVKHIILNEEYKEIGSVEFELENGIKEKSIVSLKNKDGKQMYHIAKDDGCYVPYAQSLKEGKSRPTSYIFPEMFAAMKKLPKLPLV